MARLFKEMDRLLAHTRESVTSMAEALIKPSVKRIIAKNEQIMAELAFQDEQVRWRPCGGVLLQGIGGAAP